MHCPGLLCQRYVHASTHTYSPKAAIAWLTPCASSSHVPCHPIQPSHPPTHPHPSTAGAKVFIASRKEAKAAAAAIVAACPDPSKAYCVGLTADLSKGEEEQKALLAAVARATGEPKLHVLINNAGTNWAAPVDSYPLSAFDKVLALNLQAVFSLTRLALPLLENAASAADPARVINIGTSLSFISLPTYASTHPPLHSPTHPPT